MAHGAVECVIAIDALPFHGTTWETRRLYIFFMFAVEVVAGGSAY